MNSSETTKHIKRTNVGGETNQAPVYIVTDGSEKDEQIGLKGALLPVVQNSIADAANQVRIVKYNWLFDSVSMYELQPLGQSPSYSPDAPIARGLWDVGATLAGAALTG